MTPRERVERACAKMLTELALLLPKGTDVSKHPFVETLVAWKIAMEDEWHLSKQAPRAAEPSPGDPQAPLEALASACKKLLPPALLAEVLTYLDPLGTFEAELKSTSAGDPQAPEPPKTCSHQYWDLGHCIDCYKTQNQIDDERRGASPRAAQQEPDACVHGHVRPVVGCVSCVLLGAHSSKAPRAAQTPPPPAK